MAKHRNNFLRILSLLIVFSFLLSNVSVFAANIDELEEIIRNLEEKNYELRKEEKIALDEYNYIQNKIEEVIDNLREEDISNVEGYDEYLNLKNEINKKNDELNTIEKNLDEKNKEISNLNLEISSLESNINNMKSSILELENKIEENRENSEKLKLERDSIEKDIENLIKEISNNEKEIEDLEKNIPIITESNNLKKEELNILKNKLILLKENLSNLDEIIKDGAFYFYEWAKEEYPEYGEDIDFGLRLLNDHVKLGNVKRREIGDATSYPNLLKTADFLEENNRLRISDNNFKVEKQYTNFTILAKAMISTNVSTDPNKGHQHTFNVFENLAWGYSDPFLGWYYEEKEIYDYILIKKEEYLKKNPEALEADALTYAYNEANKKFGNTVIGHYTNIMQGEVQLVAIAQNNDKELNPDYMVTHGLNSTWGNNEDIFISEEKYRSIIEKYKEFTDINFLKKKINNVSEDINGLEKEIKINDDEIEKFNNRIQILNKTNKINKENLNELELKKIDLDKKIEDINSLLENLNKKLLEKKENLNKLNENIELKRRDLEIENKEKIDLENLKSELLLEIESLYESLSNIKISLIEKLNNEELNRLKDLLMIKKENLNNIREDLRQNEVELDKYRKELEEAKRFDEIANIDGEENWVKKDGYWYYLKDGKKVVDKWIWAEVDINKDGKKDKNNWKYFNKEGKSQTTFYINGDTVWLSQAGPYDEYYRGWWENEAGMEYYFRESSGSRVSGWQYINNSWKYFRTSGTMVKGWQWIDGGWRYFNDEGSELIDKWAWLPIDINKDGIIDGYNWKYFNKEGLSQTTFYIDSGEVWLSEEGPYKEYYKGWWENEAGMKYYFRKSSGSRVSGWQYIDGSWRYFRSSGTLVTGKQWIEGQWYFFDYDGKLLDVFI